MRDRQWNELRPGEGEGRLVESGIPPLCAKVLAARGIGEPEEAGKFLYEELPLHDPMTMIDMDRAAGRLKAAIRDGETVAVYGDYDVDGITAASLLTLFLRGEGCRAIPYIPNRLEEGYGLNRGAVEKLKEQGAHIIVTVDCGITAVEEADYAASLGLDVIVTDHHECKETLPRALAVVDPHRGDCPYPFKHLAGVGVALKLCMAVAGGSRWDEVLDTYADLAALGTVADVMMLTGENRTIVRRGLKRVAGTRLPGLKALLREAGAEKGITSTTLGYILAPRINAAGRMGCSQVALELLLTRDPARAEELAKELCALNRERQERERDIFSQCDLLVDDLGTKERDALVLAGETWHQGVVGIVASRLSEKYAVPAFMICLQDGKGKGSCRSYGGLNLFALLEGCADLLESYGGHELAAGFTILEENLAAFRERANALARALRGKHPLETALTVDCVLSDASLLTHEGVDSLSLLEPYGAGNPKPVFCLKGCTLAGMTQVGGEKHLKLRLDVGGRNMDAIFFSHTAQELEIEGADRVDVCFYPVVNEYRERRTVQLQLCDIRPAQTRAEAEEELFRRLMAGEELTAAEARSVTPEKRPDLGNLWNYLLNQRKGKFEGTAQQLAREVARAHNRREEFVKTMVGLEVFRQLGLIQVEPVGDHLRIEILRQEKQGGMEDAPLMKDLRQMAEKQEWI